MVKVKSKYYIYILSFLFILTMVFFLLLVNQAQNFLHQHYRVELKTNYSENVYLIYWSSFEEKNNTHIDSEILLSRHVAYRVYKNKTRALFSRVFYEWFIRVYLDKEEQITIMLSTDIYKGGIKGVNKASTEYFGKGASALSNDELYEVFNKVY